MNSIHHVMHRRFFIAVAAAFALVACNAGPNAPTRADPELDALFMQLAQAEDQQQASPIEQAIWARWADSGSPTVNILLERANAAETAGDAELAERFLDQASDLAPDYAETWNRRANLYYSTDDYPGAIAAIQETLKREPRHFGALAGLGLIYEELGQQRQALEAFRAALVIHPHYEVALQGVRRLEPRVDGREA
ncbi:MAG: tetratricopeptide repeat protein [Alphaproteobacteria bacterium]|nr:tetratricopeptide repeat protein [Alphaproteobacteria bacterium]